MAKQERWFAAGEPLGWRKTDSMAKRRRIALRNRGGDKLATARALQALANVTEDSETRRKAEADAQYFYRQYRQSKKKKKR